MFYGLPGDVNFQFLKRKFAEKLLNNIQGLQENKPVFPQILHKNKFGITEEKLKNELTNIDPHINSKDNFIQQYSSYWYPFLHKK